MYLIQIDDVAAFEAITASPVLNTQLSLFGIDGVGVSHNDSNPNGTGVNARLTGQFDIAAWIGREDQEVESCDSGLVSYENRQGQKGRRWSNGRHWHRAQFTARLLW